MEAAQCGGLAGVLPRAFRVMHKAGCPYLDSALVLSVLLGPAQLVIHQSWIAEEPEAGSRVPQGLEARLGLTSCTGK